MINNRKVLAIIPARGGSKGIPNKNIIDVCGKPLIQYTLDAAKKSKYIDEIHISTDCESIISIVRELGFNVERKRPAELAQDDSATIDVLIDVLKYYEELNKQYQIILLLQVTQPLRTVEQIDNALEHFIDNKEKGLVSVSQVAQHPILMRSIDENGQLLNLLSMESTIRRQDFKDYFTVDGSIYINSAREILDRVSLNDNKIPFYMGDEYLNIDVDTERDLDYLKYVLSDNKRM